MIRASFTLIVFLSCFVPLSHAQNCESLLQLDLYSGFYKEDHVFRVPVHYAMLSEIKGLSIKYDVFLEHPTLNGQRLVR